VMVTELVVFLHISGKSPYVMDGSSNPTVPDKRSRIHEVVVVRRYQPGVLGIWSGEGMGRVEEWEVSLRVTWDRGGRILS
jgi:hypothetical protein